MLPLQLSATLWMMPLMSSAFQPSATPQAMLPLQPGATPWAIPVPPHGWCSHSSSVPPHGWCSHSSSVPPHGWCSHSSLERCSKSSPVPPPERCSHSSLVSITYYKHQQPHSSPVQFIYQLHHSCSHYRLVVFTHNYFHYWCMHPLYIVKSNLPTSDAPTSRLTAKYTSNTPTTPGPAQCYLTTTYISDATY